MEGPVGEATNDEQRAYPGKVGWCSNKTGEEYRKTLPWSYYLEIEDGNELPPPEDTPRWRAYWAAVRQERKIEEDPKLLRKSLHTLPMPGWLAG